MRLSKRIAAVALAAVMAVSMLTACGGGGGGRPDSAMSGCKDVTKLDEALARVEKILGK